MSDDPIRELVEQMGRSYALAEDAAIMSDYKATRLRCRVCGKAVVVSRYFTDEMRQGGPAYDSPTIAKFVQAHADHATANDMEYVSRAGIAGVVTTQNT